MKFTDIFIRRPVLASAVSLVIFLLGLRAWMSMTVREYPTVTTTVVTVTTAYPGASPDTVKAFITSPLQQAVASAPGIDYMTGTSAEGVSTITAYMRLNFDPNAAISQIMSKVDQVKNQLPPQSQQPVINETVGDATAFIYLSFSGKGLSQQQINDYVLRVAQPEIQGISGVSRPAPIPAAMRSRCERGSIPPAWQRAASRPRTLPMRCRPIISFPPSAAPATSRNR